MTLNEIALILLIIIGAFVGGFVYSVLKDILKELKGVKSLVLHTMSDVMEISIDVEEIKTTPKDILDFIKTERSCGVQSMSKLRQYVGIRCPRCYKLIGEVNRDRLGL